MNILWVLWQEVSRIRAIRILRGYLYIVNFLILIIGVPSDILCQQLVSPVLT